MTPLTNKPFVLCSLLSSDVGAPGAGNAIKFRCIGAQAWAEPYPSAWHEHVAFHDEAVDREHCLKDRRSTGAHQPLSLTAAFLAAERNQDTRRPKVTRERLDLVPLTRWTSNSESLN